MKGIKKNWNWIYDNIDTTAPTGVDERNQNETQNLVTVSEDKGNTF